jgi:hypothetical protein
VDVSSGLDDVEKLSLCNGQLWTMQISRWRTNLELVLLGEIADDVTIVKELLQLFSILPAVHTQNILVPDILIDTGKLAAANVIDIVLILQRVDLLLNLGIGEIALG